MIRYVDFHLSNLFMFKDQDVVCCCVQRVVRVKVWCKAEDQAVGNSCWVCELTMAGCICVSAWLSL